jgi:mono/diheme cytochrome c family protein
MKTIRGRIRPARVSARRSDGSKGRRLPVTGQRPSLSQWLRLLAWLSAMLALGPSTSMATASDVVLHFSRAGSPTTAVGLAALREACGVQRVEVDDPYYGRRKVFLACPIAKTLEIGFGVPSSELAQEDYLLRALDGYAKPAAGDVLFAPGGYIAFADADLSDPAAVPFQPRFEHIDRRQLDPAPFYMVWSGVGEAAAHELPWPYQLSTIEIATGNVAFPRAVPTGLAADSEAWRGFRLFTAQCISCHAINGEGGRVGPDLNVPLSIVEYRPRDQIKAYIRDPQAFRYTTMPPHPGLTDEDLDALVAYFEAMSERKFDPGRKAAGMPEPDPAPGEAHP